MILFRTFLLILIIWLLVAQIFFIAIPLSLFYLFKFGGYEIVLVAILVDGYYQAFYSVPLLSIIALFSVVLFNLIKPFLLMYTGDNEVVS